MKKIIIALFFALSVAVRGAHAQNASVLQINAPSGTQRFTPSMRGTRYYPMSSLVAMGAVVNTERGTLAIDMFGERIRMRVHSPFFTAGGDTFQLAFDVDSIDGPLQIPEQFFVQFIPSRYARSVAYQDNVLTVRPSSPVPAVSTASTAPAASTTSSASRPRTVAVAPIAASTGQAPRRIVILDPGHGGVDPGAKGPNGLQEKDATLMIAKRLSSILRGRGYEVHLTRTTDTLISLGDRPRMANQWKGSEPGALYISIHNNSGVPAAHGFETYFLADASTDDERRVADMENAAIKYEKSTRPMGSELDQVLNGLRNDFYLKASNAFGDVVQHDMAQFHPGPNRGVKRANFRVLIGALMPAVLVEVAFISNPREADLLGSSSFQDKVAYSLAQSVDAFFHDNEPLWVKQ